MKITQAAAGFAIAAAAVVAPTTLLLTTPVAHASPWSGCEDTATTLADFNACDAEISKAFDQCGPANLGDPSGLQDCQAAVAKRRQRLAQHELNP